MLLPQVYQVARSKLKELKKNHYAVRKGHHSQDFAIFLQGLAVAGKLPNATQISIVNELGDVTQISIVNVLGETDGSSKLNGRIARSEASS